MFISPSSLMAETYICKGSFYLYKYEFADLRCRHEQKTHKAIPRLKKKGELTYLGDITREACWESMAKIQVDHATCCLVSADKTETSSCSNKKIKY